MALDRASVGEPIVNSRTHQFTNSLWYRPCCESAAEALMADELDPKKNENEEMGRTSDEDVRGRADDDDEEFEDIDEDEADDEDETDNVPS
jgi:hypothetical protein